MDTPFQYVRRKDSPNVYIMSGYSDFSGQFDNALYEQVTGSLPENAALETTPSATDALDSAIRSLGDTERASVVETEMAVRYLLNKNPQDTTAAKILLQNLPDEPFMGLKQSVLALLP